METATPRSILEALCPTVLECARYAREIQERIHATDDKEGAANIFAAALSDADLSVQCAVEVAMLARFPQLPFFGEEWKASRNTKYFPGTGFIDGVPYLVTLDPIDGTRLYLDGGKNYQIILNVISRDAFEATLIVYPAYGDYVYAIRGQGAFYGSFDTPMGSATSWKKKDSLPSRVYVQPPFREFLPELRRRFDEVSSSAEYQAKKRDFYYNAVRCDLRGALLAEAQVIDGAALAFVAQEMGYRLSSRTGGPLPRLADCPDLVVPGFIVAADGETEEILREISDRVPAVQR